MITVQIPPPYRFYTGNESLVSIQGMTIEEMTANLLARYPDLRSHIQNRRGEIRPFINFLVNGTNIKILQGPATKLEPGDVVQIIPNVVGG